MDTFTSNALGTAVLLESVKAEKCGAAVVIVTSDKCYRNDNSGCAFIETDPLGGNDVYSMSKAVAELVTASWHASFFSKDDSLGALGTGRAGNVIGGGDYAEDRIVPDAVRAHESGDALVLRSPGATRPWQHVLESVSGYLALGHRLLVSPEKDRLLNYNFGPNPESVRSVQDLVDSWLRVWPQAFPVETPGHVTYAEAARLSLDPALAKEELGWIPVWDFEKTVSETARWYQERHAKGADAAAMLELTRRQISDYTNDAALAGVTWAQ
jgi:CDP-glucose 4,6-dehydratase